MNVNELTPKEKDMLAAIVYEFDITQDESSYAVLVALERMGLVEKQGNRWVSSRRETSPTGVTLNGQVTA